MEKKNELKEQVKQELMKNITDCSTRKDVLNKIVGLMPDKDVNALIECAIGVTAEQIMAEAMGEKLKSAIGVNGVFIGCICV